jgi:hypothetical protein
MKLASITWLTVAWYYGILPSSATIKPTAWAPSIGRASAKKRATALQSSSTTATTGVARNPNFAKLAGGYLFPEISRRRNKYLQENPEMKDKIISLGIGDTTQPIPSYILQGLVAGATKLGTNEGYTGYGAEQGNNDLRQKIATTLYQDRIAPDEVFVSDGAKCDIMRLQQMFGPYVVSAVQDPSYPVYVDTSVMLGQTGDQNVETRQYEKVNIRKAAKPTSNSRFSLSVFAFLLQRSFTCLALQKTISFLIMLVSRVLMLCTSAVLSTCLIKRGVTCNYLICDVSGLLVSYSFWCRCAIARRYCCVSMNRPIVDS